MFLCLDSPTLFFFPPFLPMTRTHSDMEKGKEWGEGINRCRGELENIVLEDFLKCL